MNPGLAANNWTLDILLASTSGVAALLLIRIIRRIDALQEHRARLLATPSPNQGPFCGGPA